MLALEHSELHLRTVRFLFHFNLFFAGQVSKGILAVRWSGHIVMKLNDLGLADLLQDLKPDSVTCNDTKGLLVSLSFK